jgi:hypothetical protein
MSWLIQDTRDFLKDALNMWTAAELALSKEHSSQRSNSRAFCGHQQRSIGTDLRGELVVRTGKTDPLARLLSFRLEARLR